MAKRRFFRPPPPRSNLGRIVWDPKENRAMAEFNKEDNQFFTDNESVANHLLKLGYVEVGLEDELPPYIPDMPVMDVGDVRLNPKMTEDHDLQKVKREEALKGSDAPQSAPPVPEKKASPKQKPAAKKAAPKKAAPKKALKRRVKREV